MIHFPTLLRRKSPAPALNDIVMIKRRAHDVNKTDIVPFLPLNENIHPFVQHVTHNERLMTSPGEFLEDEMRRYLADPLQYTRETMGLSQRTLWGEIRVRAVIEYRRLKAKLHVWQAMRQMRAYIEAERVKWK